MKLIISALLIVVVHSFTVYAASFDCKRAATSVEKTICSDLSLSKLDEELVTVYAKALVAVPDPDILKKEQRAWLKKRNKQCGISTLKNSYAARINKLKGLNANILPNLKISDKRILGDWESFSTAFYDTGIITIDSMWLKHEACKTYFILRDNNGNEFSFEAANKNTCFAFESRAVNYIKVVAVNNNEIGVRYYNSLYEKSLLGDGVYNK